MMASVSLIPPNELKVLQAASAVSAIAREAPMIHEEEQIAYAINTATNTGAFSVIYDHDISDNVKEILEENGYKLRSRNMAVGYSYIISWEDGNEQQDTSVANH